MIVLAKWLNALPKALLLLFALVFYSALAEQSWPVEADDEGCYPRSLVESYPMNGQSLTIYYQYCEPQARYFIEYGDHELLLAPVMPGIHYRLLPGQEGSYPRTLAFVRWSGGANCCSILGHILIDPLQGLTRLADISLGRNECEDHGYETTTLSKYEVYCLDSYHSFEPLSLKIPLVGFASFLEDYRGFWVPEGDILFEDGRFRWLFHGTNAEKIIAYTSKFAPGSRNWVMHHYVAALIAGNLDQQFEQALFRKGYQALSERDKKKLFSALQRSRFWPDFYQRYAELLLLGDELQ